MTIWILALLLFGCLAGIGYQQGAIRVAISFVGIIVAALLAVPLDKLVKPAVAALGVVNPVLLWLLPPFIVFVIVLSLFKVIGFAVHRKVAVHYKYELGDLRLVRTIGDKKVVINLNYKYRPVDSRLALWEQLNARLGLCLSLLNGLAYLVLLSMLIYMFSYWTVQLASPADPKIINIFNRMGRDLQRTGMARVARAIDPMGVKFYDAADLAGLIFQNALIETRLSRYPAFLALAEKQEFQAIVQDKPFTIKRLMGAPISEILKDPNVQKIVNSTNMLNSIWNIVSPDLKDLREFLEKGQSAKYSEKILGRWHFDVNGAMAAYRRAKPFIRSSEMLTIKKWMAGANTMLIAGTDHQVLLRNVPQLKQQPGQPLSMELQTLQGQWKGEQGEYELALGGSDKRKAKVEAGRLIVTGEGLTLVFTPED